MKEPIESGYLIEEVVDGVLIQKDQQHRIRKAIEHGRENLADSRHADRREASVRVLEQRVLLASGHRRHRIRRNDGRWNSDAFPLKRGDDHLRHQRIETRILLHTERNMAGSRSSANYAGALHAPAREAGLARPCNRMAPTNKVVPKHPGTVVAMKKPKSFIVQVVLLAGTSAAGTGPALAQEPVQPDAPGPSSLDGVWSVTFGFGEIPFLAGSFKPSVGFGYHFNRFIYLGTIVQWPDFIERGDESFNAVNANVDGLVSTREQTGARMFLGARLRPHRYSPYLSLGAVFNGTDTETMEFDERARNLGSTEYEGGFEVEVARPFGIRPAFGLGYAYTFDSGIVLNLEFSGAWLFKPATPNIRILDPNMPEEARQNLTGRFRQAYDDNFHNRYHLFNLGVGFAW